jgi:hypothetical protein
MLFPGKWMELENIVLSEISQVEKFRGYIFPHMWKVDLEDTHINTYMSLY